MLQNLTRLSRLKIRSMGSVYYEPYKGFTYEPWVDDGDPEVRKIFHEIIHNGKDVSPTWFRNISPYQYASREEFKRAVNEIYFTFWLTDGKIGATI